MCKLSDKDGNQYKSFLTRYNVIFNSLIKHGHINLLICEKAVTSYRAPDLENYITRGPHA